MMHVIVPAAGLSSRFPGMKPKYLLYDYSHKLMVQRAVEPYLEKGCQVTIGILKEHNEKYHAHEFIRHELGSKVNVVVLPEVTKGPADTVYQIIHNTPGLIDQLDEILIKDCDSFFDHEYSMGNYICVSNIADHEVLKKLASKSFVVSNEQGIITDIVEKKVVSDTFCVGGYKFSSAKLYCDTFEEISSTNEIFVSDVIQRLLFNGTIITEKKVTNYFDVGTAADWFEFNDKPVIFCDVDGTIIKSQSRVGVNTYEDEPVILDNNVKILLDYQSRGSQIIFTTARPKQYEDRTRQILDSFGFHDYQLLIGLQNSKRILINDYNKSNPYPRAEAINIPRDSDTLNEHM